MLTNQQNPESCMAFIEGHIGHTNYVMIVNLVVFADVTVSTGVLTEDGVSDT